MKVIKLSAGSHRSAKSSANRGPSLTLCQAAPVEKPPHEGQPGSRATSPAQLLPAAHGQGLARLSARCLVAAVLSASATSAGASAAAERGEWQPRRHHRRLEPEELREYAQVEPVQPVKRAKTLSASTGQPAAAVQHQLTDAKSALEHALQTGLREVQHGARQMQHTAQHGSKAVQRRLRRGSEQRLTSTAEGPSWQRLQPAAQGVGEALLIGAVIAACFWLLDRLWRLIRGARDGQRTGYYRRDRSLGGKTVFIKNEPAQRRESVPLNPFTVGDEKRLEAVREVAAPPAVSSPGTANSGEPAWWDLPRERGYVHPKQREQAVVRSKEIVRELENAKISGMDYPVSLLAELRISCATAGQRVRTSTESGRDAMFRAAVATALQMAQDSTSGLIAGCTPAQFVCGLSADLGVPQEKAVNVVHSQVAAQVRNLIIAACAGTRSKDSTSNLVSLLGLTGLLEKFPLPAGSPQGELVAAGITQRCSLSERKEVFLTYGAMAPGSAQLAAELLGFNPDDVVPQLEKRHEGRASMSQAQA